MITLTPNSERDLVSVQKNPKARSLRGRENILLSICIPTHNRADLVHQLVLECLEIDSDKVEVVVSDNFSTDHTEDLLSQIHDERFLYYRNSKNTLGANIGDVVRKGNGKFCLLIRDKDCLPPPLAARDWFKRVESTLEQSDDTTTFEGSLRRVDDFVMAGVEDEVFKRNTLKAYLHVLYDDTYCTSIIFPRRIIENVFDVARNVAPYYWSIYPHMSLLFFCAKYGDIVPMESLAVKMRVSNSEVYFDKPKEGELPYGAVEARKEQMIDIAKLFKFFNFPNTINLPFLEHLMVRQCQWLQVAFGTPYAWSYIPKDFPKFHYWHKVFWESYLKLAEKILSLYGIKIVDSTIGTIYQYYDQFCNMISTKEVSDAHALFFADND